MSLPPYVRSTACPGCGHGVYVQAEEYDAGTAGGKARKRLRVRGALVEDAPKVMSGCGCAWLRKAVTAEAAGGAERINGEDRR